jgi:hypothetical protein
VPKEHRGLGIRDPKLENLSLGSKFLWIIVTGKQEWLKTVIVKKIWVGYQKEKYRFSTSWHPWFRYLETTQVHNSLFSKIIVLDPRKRKNHPPMDGKNSNSKPTRA